MFIIIILFFMYIFPIFFLTIPVIRTTPYAATALLVLGVILWLVQTYMISKFITIPRKQARQHKRVQRSGKAVQAEVLASEHDGLIDDEPSKKILLSFTNLVGSQVKTYIQLVDTKEHEKRFDPGKEITIKLNQNSFEPPFTAGKGEYETPPRPWIWFWLIFNLLYMVGFFLVSYYLQSDGFGWRFLNPFSPWLWAPVLGIFIINFLLKTFGSQDIITTFYPLQSFRSNKNFGELLLYGKTTQGEIVNFSQTGTYINEQPQVRFDVHFLNDKGDLLNKRFKQIIPLTDLHELKKGEAEVIYLPRDTDIFMVKPSQSE
ncbi:hypothetical protein HMPREF2811_02865 [Globicatella sp. HMSC072A10]|uniref:hypothetical protein n=1 Tax=Globicatella sp. HMSC072A10 TaxID=1739315 RepID=UPI0008AB70B3|nr:hypothetical protein [Globicatella sp. HMSC072A10]OFK61624.1 hypothetical protein HMPREF2811_02865 [Globicatella sp. HMSC072A10]